MCFSFGNVPWENINDVSERYDKTDSSLRCSFFYLKWKENKYISSSIASIVVFKMMRMKPFLKIIFLVGMVILKVLEFLILFSIL
jgi:hypothetical protein